MTIAAFELDPRKIRDISPEVLDETGRLRILSASYWAATTKSERGLFGHTHGLYHFPTAELVAHLGTLIEGKLAIEIGAGSGVLAEALGIVATDSRQQEKEPWRSQIEAMGTPLVRYGPNVVPLSAAKAVRRYKPDVVIAAWVTHKYDPQRHWAGGNEAGVDEADVLRHCGQYIFIGNGRVHFAKPIWRLPHAVTYPDFLYSRAMNPSPDLLSVWDGL